ncbi:MAG: hypothetical protein K0R92_3132, partial [Lachnospiraceae bacterium]|nr:hypothetical protein [Lachnospiraceae bacterium]
MTFSFIIVLPVTLLLIILFSYLL